MGPQGIRTNAVSPGFFRTALSESHYRMSDQLNARINSIPLRCLGTPENVADAVAYLAGSGAAFINGQEIIVDGGFLDDPDALAAKEGPVWWNVRR
jgi:NAD(P)-dependent dehydrogenase (short-subunit alcohol dehydrogenase family)